MDRDRLDTISESLNELSLSKVLGSPAPQVSGIEDFDDEDLFDFQPMMEGLSSGEIETVTEQQSAAEYAEDLTKDLEPINRRLQNAAIFQSILAECNIRFHLNTGQSCITKVQGEGLLFSSFV